MIIILTFFVVLKECKIKKECGTSSKSHHKINSSHLEPVLYVMNSSAMFVNCTRFVYKKEILNSNCLIFLFDVKRRAYV